MLITCLPIYSAGLKRCKDAITHSASHTEEDALSLAEEYLKASPEAAEIFNLWAAKKGETGRIATLCVDLLGVIVAFSSTELAAPLARKILYTRGRVLVSGFASKSPRFIRCSLKLLTSIVRLGPSLARDVVRQLSLTSTVIESLSTTRHDTGLDATSGSNRNYMGMSKRAIRAIKATGGSAALDPQARAKHIHIHGHPGDDVRGCFVRFVTALLSCGTPDVIRDTIRIRGLVAGIVKGLAGDGDVLVLQAIGAMGDAFLLSGAVPAKLCMDVLNVNILSTLLALYDRVPVDSKSDTVTKVRHAIHAFLIGVTTGQIPTTNDIEMAEAGIIPIELSNYEAKAKESMQKSKTKQERHNSSRHWFSKHIGGKRHEVVTKGGQVRRINCVFGKSQTEREQAIPTQSKTRLESPDALLDIAQSHLAQVDEDPLQNQLDTDLQDGASSALRQLMAVESSLQPRAKSSSSGTDQGPVRESSLSSKLMANALDFLKHIRASEDLLQRDLALRLIREFPSLLVPYLRAFPYAMEGRPTPRWLHNVRYLSLLMSISTTGTEILKHHNPSMTVLIHNVSSTPDSHALTNKTSTGSTKSIPSVASNALSLTLGSTTRATISKQAVTTVTPIVPGDNVSSQGSTSTVGGVPAIVLVRSAIPPCLAKGTLTRILLHSDPAVVLAGLGLLTIVLNRTSRLLRELCQLRPNVVQESSQSKDSAPLAQETISVVLKAAKTLRANILSQAILEVLPDIQTIISARTKVMNLFAAKSSLETTDAEFKSGNPAGESGPVSISVEGMNINAQDPKSNATVTKMQLAFAIFTGLVDVLRGYVLFMGPAEVANALAASGIQGSFLPVGIGGLPLLAPTSGRSLSTGFDFLRLVPVELENANTKAVQPTPGEAKSETVGSSLSSYPEFAQLALLNLLKALPVPTQADLLEKWMDKTWNNAQASAATLNAPGLSTLPDDESVAIRSVSMLPKCPLVAVLDLLANAESSRKLRNELSSVTNLALSLLKRITHSAIDAAATVLANSTAQFALPASSFDMSMDVDSQSDVSFDSFASLQQMNVNSNADMLEVAGASFAFKVFRVKPLGLPLHSINKQLNPCLGYLPSEADVWLHELAAATRPNSIQSGRPYKAAFYGLFWAASTDALPSSQHLGSLPTFKNLFKRFSTDDVALKTALAAAPFTIRTWLAFAVGLATVAEEAVEDHEGLISPLEKLAVNLGLGPFLPGGTGTFSSGTSEAGSISGGSATTRSAAIMSGASKVSAYLISAHICSFLVRATQSVLFHLPIQERTGVLSVLTGILSPMQELLHAWTQVHDVPEAIKASSLLSLVNYLCPVDDKPVETMLVPLPLPPALSNLVIAVKQCLPLTQLQKISMEQSTTGLPEIVPLIQGTSAYESLSTAIRNAMTVLPIASTAGVVPLSLFLCNNILKTFDPIIDALAHYPESFDLFVSAPVFAIACGIDSDGTLPSASSTLPSLLVQDLQAASVLVPTDSPLYPHAAHWLLALQGTSEAVTPTKGKGKHIKSKNVAEQNTSEVQGTVAMPAVLSAAVANFLAAIPPIQLLRLSSKSLVLPNASRLRRAFLVSFWKQNAALVENAADESILRLAPYEIQRNATTAMTYCIVLGKRISSASDDSVAAILRNLLLAILETVSPTGHKTAVTRKLLAAVPVLPKNAWSTFARLTTSEQQRIQQYLAVHSDRADVSNTFVFDSNGDEIQGRLYAASAALVLILASQDNQAASKDANFNRVSTDLFLATLSSISSLPNDNANQNVSIMSSFSNVEVEFFRATFRSFVTTLYERYLANTSVSVHCDTLSATSSQLSRLLWIFSSTQRRRLFHHTLSLISRFVGSSGVADPSPKKSTKSPKSKNGDDITSSNKSSELLTTSLIPFLGSLVEFSASFAESDCLHILQSVTSSDSSLAYLLSTLSTIAPHELYPLYLPLTRYLYNLIIPHQISLVRAIVEDETLSSTFERVTMNVCTYVWNTSAPTIGVSSVAVLLMQCLLNLFSNHGTTSDLYPKLVKCLNNPWSNAQKLLNPDSLVDTLNAAEGYANAKVEISQDSLKTLELAALAIPLYNLLSNSVEYVLPPEVLLSTLLADGHLLQFSESTTSPAFDALPLILASIFDASLAQLQKRMDVAILSDAAISYATDVFQFLRRYIRKIPKPSYEKSVEHKCKVVTSPWVLSNPLLQVLEVASQAAVAMLADKHISSKSRKSTIVFLINLSTLLLNHLKSLNSPSTKSLLARGGFNHKALTKALHILHAILSCVPSSIWEEWSSHKNYDDFTEGVQAFLLAVFCHPRASAQGSTKTGFEGQADTEAESDDESSDDEVGSSADSKTDGNVATQQSFYAGINLLSFPGALALSELLLLRSVSLGIVPVHAKTPSVAVSSDEESSSDDSSGSDDEKDTTKPIVKLLTGETLSVQSIFEAFISHPSFFHLLLRNRDMNIRLPYSASSEYVPHNKSFVASKRKTGELLLTTYKPIVYSYPWSRPFSSLVPQELLATESAFPMLTDIPRLATVRLIARCIAFTKDACVPPLLPVLAAAYSASLSTIDRIIRLIFAKYEEVGGQTLSPASIGYTWSASALPHIQWNHPVFSVQFHAKVSDYNKHSVFDSRKSSVLPGTSARPNLATVYDWILSSDSASALTGLANPVLSVNEPQDRRRARKRAMQTPVARKRHTSFGVTGPRAFASATGLVGWQIGLVPHRTSSTIASFPYHRGIVPEHAPSLSIGKSWTKELEILSILRPLRFSDSIQDIVFASPVDEYASNQSIQPLSRVHAQSKHKNRAMVYDPSYILPALLHALVASTSAKDPNATAVGGNSGAQDTTGTLAFNYNSRHFAKRFVSSGALAIALSATCSSNLQVRKAAYSIVGAYFDLISPALTTAGWGHKGSAAKKHIPGLYKEAAQVALALSVFRASVTAPFLQMSPILVSFLSECLFVLLKPLHPLYPLLNRLFLKKQSFDIHEIPLLYLGLGGGDALYFLLTAGADSLPVSVPENSSLASTAAASLQSALATTAAAGSTTASLPNWILRIVMRGIQSANDHVALRRKHGYHLLLSLFNSAITSASLSTSGHHQLPYATVQLLRNILSIFLSAARLGTLPKSIEGDINRKIKEIRSKKRRKLQDESAESSSSDSSDSDSSDSDSDSESEDERELLEEADRETRKHGKSTSSDDEDDSDDDDDTDAESVIVPAISAPVMDNLVQSIVGASEEIVADGAPTSTSNDDQYSSVLMSSNSATTSPFPTFAVASYLRKTCAVLPWIRGLFDRAASALTPVSNFTAIPHSSSDEFNITFAGLPYDILLSLAEINALVSRGADFPVQIQELRKEFEKSKGSGKSGSKRSRNDLNALDVTMSRTASSLLSELSELTFAWASLIRFASMLLKQLLSKFSSTSSNSTQVESVRAIALPVISQVLLPPLIEWTATLNAFDIATPIIRTQVLTMALSSEQQVQELLQCIQMESKISFLRDVEKANLISASETFLISLSSYK